MKHSTWILCVALCVGSAVLVRADDKVDRAVKMVMARMSRDGKVLTSLSMDCLSFSSSTDAEVSSATDVDIREKHDARCGGDPQTAPLVATFRVNGRRVLILDSVSGQYVPWDMREGPAIAAEIRSFYTPLMDDKVCEVNATGDAQQGHGDRRNLRCPGVQGYQLAIEADSTRERIVGVLKDGKEQKLSMSGPSRLGRKAEWRVRGEEPIALIFRVYVESDDSAQSLVVAKISSSQSCVVKMIDTREVRDANRLARAVADQSQSMECLW